MTLERIAALRDERMQCYSRCQEINKIQEESKQPLTEEQKANFKQSLERYNACKTEMDSLQADLDRKHTLENMEQEMFSASKRDNGPRLVVEPKSVKGVGGEEMTEEQKYSLALKGMDLFFRRQIGPGDLHQFGLSSDEIQKGGIFNPPPQWSNEILLALRPLSKIRQLADVLPPIESPGGIGKYTMSALGRPTRVSEKERAPVSDVTFGKREMYTHDQEYVFKISNKLLKVSTMPIVNMMKDEAARGFAEEQELEFILADGDKKPLGFMYPSNDGVPSSRHYQDHASNSTISLEAIKILPKYVHETLRAGGVYLMHTDIQYLLYLKKDTTNQYLWQPSNQAGVPDKFNGYQIITADKMPNSVSSNALVAAFANMKEYKILDSSQMDFSVEPHLFWQTKETGFALTVYNDGQPQRKDAFAISKMSS